MKRLAAVIICLIYSPLIAQEPTPPAPPEPPEQHSVIVAPNEVSGTGKKADPFIFTTATRCLLRLTGEANGVNWDTEDAPTDIEILDNKYISFSLYEAGLYQITAHGGNVYSKVWFQIHSGTDPPPGPTPPEPTPEPNPQPVIIGKLWIVIVEDAAQRSKYPSSQIQTLLSPKLRDYAKTHCLTGTDGRTPEFKVYDKSADVSRQSPAIQKAFKTAVDDMTAAASAGPWLTTSNGKAGFSGPLPADLDATLAKLAIYGGP